MKVISQIDERTFVVRMEDHDLTEEQHVFVAHDYFSVSQRRGISADPRLNLYGKFVSCGCVEMYQQCHISIRPMIELVMPFLQRHPYMQKAHLFEKDGSLSYNYSGVNIVLHGPEVYTKQEDDSFLCEYESLHCKTVRCDDDLWSFEKFYSIDKTTTRYKLVKGLGASDLPSTNERIIQDFTLIKE